MTPFFFYGTLRYLPLLERVVGSSDLSGRVSEAVLPGYAAHLVAGQDFPMLVAAPGQSLRGVLLHGVTEGERARLEYYEGDGDYHLREIAVEVGGTPQRAAVFEAAQGRLVPGEAWDFDAWLRDWAAITLEAEREAMSYFGQFSAAEMMARFPRIQARAAGRARLLARPAPAEGPGRDDVDLVELRRPYTEFFAFQEFDLRHPRFDGTMSDVISRGVLASSHAVIVLPYDPVRDRVLLIEQFRTGPYAAGDPNPWMLEPVAGMVDAGEAPETTARREAQEEAGLTLHDLEALGESYPSPGVSAEMYHFFVGLCDLPDGIAGFGGLESEGEDIKSHLLNADDLFAKARAGAIRNTPLLMLAFWLELNRDRLRASA